MRVGGGGKENEKEILINGNIQYSLEAWERNGETQLITGFFTFTLDNGYLHNNLTHRLPFINKHM